MYFETQIGKLSKVQLNNLLKGKNVRIKSGTAHVIYLTEAQVKKFHRNARQGKAFTVKLNQDQIAKQGSGLLGDLIGLVHPTAGMVAKTVGLGMKKKGKGLIIPGYAGDILERGLFDSFIGKKKGNGFLADFAKQKAIELAKTAGKFAVEKGTELAKDKASEFLINKIEGMGARRKKVATPAQLAALAKGRAIRDANRYGGALYAAGH